MKLRAGVIAVVLIGAFLGFLHPARAATTYTVNTTADTHDATIGDGICADSLGHCSLRAALEESNGDAAGVQVTLPAGTYVLAGSGLSTSNSGLTVSGAGESSTIIDANHNTAVTPVLSVTGPANLTLSGVTVQNGAGYTGILVSGQLFLDSSIVQNNASTGVEGGGLDVGPGGTATVTNSRFTGNSIANGSGIGGGAIGNRAGTLTLLASTIDHNTSAGAGGGLALDGTSTLLNDTITANAANGNGGGGINVGPATVVIHFSTIDANTAVPYGGGIQALAGTTKYAQIGDSIMYGNTATSNGNNCFGSTGIQSTGYNIEGGTDCAFTAAGDQQNTNPMLATLADNGGPTPTQAIAIGAPADDHADPACPPPSTDQRGIPRPIGPACDVGAFEALPFPSVSLPAVMNNAYGGFSTTAYITNKGSSAAAINILYYDQNGTLVGHDGITNLPPHATWTVSQTNGNSFVSGQAGSGIVYSNQPVSSFVNEFHGTNDGSSYTGIPITLGGATTLWAPTITNNAYGGYTTGIGLVNHSAATGDVTITYRDLNGTAVATQTITGLAPHSYRGLYSGDAGLGLPSGFAGTATLQISSGQISAVVNETGPGGQFSSYDAVNVAGSLLDAPVALNNAFNGYYTGMAIQNTTGTAGTVTVTYFDSVGGSTVKTFPIAANGYLGVYQGSATDGPAPGSYTATITSNVAIAAIVNEVAPSPTAAKQSTSYNTVATAAGSATLALVENAGSDGWSTGLGIMNTSNISVTVGVDYFDAATGASTGTHQSRLLAPNAFWGLYQPTGGLTTPGARASAVVTAPGGTIAVICNESSSTSFMSYGGQ